MTHGRINDKDLRAFAASLLTAAGTIPEEADITAKALVWADLVGRPTQGVWRLKEICPRVRRGLIRSPCEPEFIQTREGVFQVDGRNGSGRYVGHLGMEKAIETARRHGVCLVAVKNSNHNGAAAYYVELAAKAGMLGFAFTNAPRRVAAYGGASPVFGTNPFAFGAPLRDGNSVLIDFSTSAIAGSILRKGAETNQPVPAGVAVDSKGNAGIAAENGPVTLLPFGGAKGFCLGLLVEILAAVVTGSPMSFQIPSMLENPDASRPTGHAFLAMDIAALLPPDAYHARMEMLVAAIKGSALLPGVTEILLPGETRWRNYRKQLKEGVCLDSNTLESLRSLAAEMGIKPPW